MSKQIKSPRYPHIRYINNDTWARGIPLTVEQGKRYHGVRRLCFWALMLLADRIIDWDNR